MSTATTLLAVMLATAVAFALRPRGRTCRVVNPAPARRHVGGRSEHLWQRRSGRRSSRRRQRTITQALPDALDLVIVTIQAGHLPLQALREVMPSVSGIIATAFSDVVARVDRGERFRTALDALDAHLGAPALAVSAAIAGASDAGTAVTPALDRLAHDAREHRRRAAEASARELPVRLSFPLVLCTLPSFVLIAIVPLLLGALSSLRGH